jgi:glycosyltransferase involved in cell wall biosynthesis
MYPRWIKEPYVATIWGNDLNDADFPKTVEEKKALGEVIRGASRVTSDSQQLLAIAKSYEKGFLPDKYHLVYWGVDTELFIPSVRLVKGKEWRRRLEIPLESPVLISPRHIALHYNPLIILEAFERSQWKEKGFLVFKVHRGDAYEEGLIKTELAVRQSPYRERIRFVPPCYYSEIPGLYAMADLAISLVQTDGAPATFFELMAVGTPIVCTDLDAYNGIIKHGITGFRVSPTVEEVVKALNSALKYPEKLNDLRNGGFKWIGKQANWNLSIEYFEDIYRNSIKHKNESFKPRQ